MLGDFLVRAALAGVGVSLAAGLLGCFVVWRRMAFFGDAVAHAAILGVALSLGFSVSVFVGVFVVALLMALILWSLEGRGLGQDTVLGVLAYGSLAFGLVLAAVLPGGRVDLDAYLFGDVLTVTRGDLAVIWGGGAVGSGVVGWQWQAMLTATLSHDLAYAAGLDPRRSQLLLTVMLAAMVAVAIKVVGALLITALLIIPAAAARQFGRTPEGMAVWAMGIGAVASLSGLGAAVRINSPVGPTMVCAAVVMFALARMFAFARGKSV
jgi:zinc transport system permease protein